MEIRLLLGEDTPADRYGYLCCEVGIPTTPAVAVRWMQLLSLSIMITQIRNLRSRKK